MKYFNIRQRFFVETILIYLVWFMAVLIWGAYLIGYGRPGGNRPKDAEKIVKMVFYNSAPFDIGLIITPQDKRTLIISEYSCSERGRAEPGKERPEGEDRVLLRAFAERHVLANIECLVILSITEEGARGLLGVLSDIGSSIRSLYLPANMKGWDVFNSYIFAGKDAGHSVRPVICGVDLDRKGKTEVDVGAEGVRSRIMPVEKPDAGRSGKYLFNPLVFEVSCGSFSALFCGSLSSYGEMSVLSDDIVRYNVVEMSYNGREDIVSEVFLGRLSPELCFLHTCGSGSSEKLSQDDVEKFEKKQVRLYRLTKGKEYSLSTDGNGWVVEE